MSIQRAAIATSAALLLMGQTAPDPATSPAADGAGQASPDPITAEQAIAAAQELYGPPPPKPEVSAECSNPAPGEIVVCAALEEQSQFRIPSSSDKGDDSQLSCSENGVLAPLVGVIGSLQALEAIKLLAGYGEPAVGRLQVFDGKTLEWRSLALKRDAHCPVCGG